MFSFMEIFSREKGRFVRKMLNSGKPALAS